MKQFTEIKTFDHACKVVGLDPKKAVPDFKGYTAKENRAMIAHAKLVIIARAINRLANAGKQWKPDWNDSNQPKYFPWFYMGGSSGFRFCVYADWTSDSSVGSRLCFISCEAAEYAGKQFLKLYKDYFVI